MRSCWERNTDRLADRPWAVLGSLTALLLMLPGVGAAEEYEVWLSDQANTQGITTENPNGTHGGKIRIYEGSDLEQNPPINRPTVLDVTADLFPTALATTGAHVARIHGVLPSPDHVYMALNFVASGHLGIVDGRTKKPVCLFRTTGTSTGRQNHMSFWTPDGHHIIVANQNGRILERVDVVRNEEGVPERFAFNGAASLDLVGGPGRVLGQPVAVDADETDGIACQVTGLVADGQPTTTPTGAAKQAPGLRVTNAPICPVPTSTGRHAFVTLGGGGMFVVDITASPMAIVAEYDLSVIRAAGCGGAEGDGFMHLNTGTSGPNVSEFSLYRFALNYPSAPAFNTANTPAPVAVWQDKDNGKIGGNQIPAGSNRDAHGVVIVRNPESGAAGYLHQMDRIRNNVEVFKLSPPWDDLNKRYEGTYSLTTSGACGGTVGTTRTNDPTPDLGDFSPSTGQTGGRIYVALRGPFPLTISHAADGSCPGLGIIDLSSNRRSGSLSAVMETTVLNADESRNLSDPHAAIVRKKTSVN